MIPIRHWRRQSSRPLRLWHLSLAGLCIGFLTGLVLSTGPLSVPVFTAYGLSSGAFLSTEAASALVLYASKVATFRQMGAMNAGDLAKGMLVGSSLMTGTYAGKKLLMHLSPSTFSCMLDVLMVCSGASLLWAAAHA